ncbi:lachesin-like [Photinus pyralis]|uniref:lachesin-like n=1 Tax=Photinus pyralis TaxID=7054 RepID=UPI001266F553|nr:lachesin-like [Photinus pyralis]
MRNLITDILISENPKFGEPIKNVTVPVGREAIFTCVVEDLGTYKVAWLRVDTQTILTIHNHLITKSSRISITNSENRTWYLHIRDVQEHDRGWYMCQINTDPMKSQVGYLDVVVSPDILDYATSADMVVEEGSNVTLRCEAKGYPHPRITWRREGGEDLHLSHGLLGLIAYGPVLSIHHANRQDMGPYLCIAFNGVPPSVSKRIMLIVNFPPTIQVDKQLLGTYDGFSVTIECHSEAYPKSINYWTKDNGDIVPQNEKFFMENFESSSYGVHMKLTIRNTTQPDYGSYQCISKNIVGEAEETIQIYRNTYNFTMKDSSKSSIYHADLSHKDSLFLGDGYYNSAECDYVNQLLVASTFLLLTWPRSTRTSIKL